MRKTLLLATAALALLTLPALAANGKPQALPLGKFGKWEAAHFSDESGNKVCYMATAPASTKSSAPLKGRDPNVLLFVTHWPADKEKNAVTLSSGYPYKDGTKAVVTIGGKTFNMLTGSAAPGAAPDMAWIDDNAIEDELAEQIRKGETLTVKGTSKRGTVITDTFSLAGSGEAYDAITKACEME